MDAIFSVYMFLSGAVNCIMLTDLQGRNRGKKDEMTYIRSPFRLERVELFLAPFPDLLRMPAASGDERRAEA